MTTVTCRHVMVAAATAMSLFMGGCATPSAPSSPPLSPSSPGLTSGVKRPPLQTDYEKRLSACGHDGSCDRLHFILGLSALQSHPDVAAAHFREVMKTAPKSSTANLSRLWLNVLGEARREDKPVAVDTTEWLLLELLNRDKQVEELSKQLNALKSVDLDMKERTARMKPRIAPLPKTENGQ